MRRKTMLPDRTSIYCGRMGLAFGPVTINDAMVYLGLPEWSEPAGTEILRWPPDVFGATAFILRESGAYKEIINPCPKNELRLRATAIEWAECTKSSSVTTPLVDPEGQSDGNLRDLGFPPPRR